MPLRQGIENGSFLRHSLLNRQRIALETQTRVDPELAGQLNSLKCSLKRWESNPGSVFSGNQKLSIRVPHLRDTEENEEVGNNLFEAFKEDVSKPVVAVTMYANTFRRQFLDTAGKLVRHAGKLILKIPKTTFERLQLDQLFASCQHALVPI